MAVGSALGSAITGPRSGGQGADSLPGEGLGEADAVAGGLADVGVVQKPVDGRGGKGFGHEFVERIWGCHMFVRTDPACYQRECAPACPVDVEGVFALC